MSSTCLVCRLRALTPNVKTLCAPSPLRHVSTYPFANARHLALSRYVALRSFQNSSRVLKEANEDPSESVHAASEAQLEARARAARQEFGDALPDGHLGQEETRMYERLYGSASRMQEHLQEEHHQEAVAVRGETTLLTEGEDGVVEEYAVEYKEQGDVVGGQGRADAEKALEQTMASLSDAEREAFEKYVDVFERLHAGATASAADEEILSNEKSAELWKRISELQPQPDEEEDDLDEAEFAEDELRDEEEDDDAEPEQDVWPGDEQKQFRTHPFTALGRFCTSPTTVELPRAEFVDPATQMLSRASTAQLREVAHKSFNGPGLPESPSTPKRSRSMKQVPIPLNAGQRKMSEMQSLVFLASVMPQVYASVLGVLVEVRKRLGKRWLRDLINKDGGAVVLDAGAGGAGVLAFREVLKAEWEVIKAEEAEEGEAREVKEERKHRRPPYGKATVLTGSDELRYRASKLLDNTTFLPRLPEAVKQGDEQNRKQYDVVIATHSLWPLDKEHQRKNQLDAYWSLLNPDGGVLVLVEKGVPRGFEVIGAARERLLKRHISSPGSSRRELRIDEQISSLPSPDPPTASDALSAEEGTVDPLSDGRFVEKETGMIIAPCTNHSGCPMYVSAGISPGRKTWCHFPQRYVRPPFLQHLLGAKGRNDDKVEFSYVAAWRGKDLRKQDQPMPIEDDRIVGHFETVTQGHGANDRAFQGVEADAVLRMPSSSESPGHEATGEPFDATLSAGATPTYPHPLQLPRAILPPLKRKKRVIIDVCTPAATLERWFVSKGYSRQAYRDARKASWGDLWALGGKSRQKMRVNFGKKYRRLMEAARLPEDPAAASWEPLPQQDDDAAELRFGDEDGGRSRVLDEVGRALEVEARKRENRPSGWKRQRKRRERRERSRMAADLDE